MSNHARVSKSASSSSCAMYMYVAVLMCAIAMMMMTALTVTVTAETDDVVTTNVYGDINPAHTTTVPNTGAGGVKYHYLLNNLPIAHLSVLSSLRFLFADNPASSSLPSIIVHVARPSPTPQQPNHVVYVASQLVDNIESGVAIDLFQHNIGVRPGDMIALSVPNDSILLRVGVNNQGLPVSYGRLAVSSGVATKDIQGAYEIQDPNPNDIEYIQLCTAFETKYGITFPNYNGFPYGYGVTEHGMFTFLNEPMTSPGVVSSVRVGIWGGTSMSNLVLAIARRASPNDPYYIIPSSIIPLPTITAFVDLNINIPTLTVQTGDLVGFGSVGAFNTNPRIINVQASTGAYLGVEMNNPTGALTSRFQWQGVNSQPTFQVTVTANINGDPQFAGFQGQQFQFHGLADEHFNLISSPLLQLNSHFVYLSSGNCNYNNTVCFQHPGTYLDVLGFTIPSVAGTGDVEIKLVAGAHTDGLRVWMGQSGTDVTREITLGAYPRGMTWVMDEQGNKATFKYNTFGEVSIKTNMFEIHVVNSDFFFNLGLSLLDSNLLRIGRTKHTITDHEICHHDKHQHARVDEMETSDLAAAHATHDHGMVEEQLLKKYGIQNQLHGLIGQTWRNVKVCGKDWMGSVNDYVVSSLFGADYYYNFYKSIINSNDTSVHV